MNLKQALARCLDSIHDYFGITDKVSLVALEDAATNFDWSPYDTERWEAVAYASQTEKTS